MVLTTANNKIWNLSKKQRVQLMHVLVTQQYQEAERAYDDAMEK